MIQLYTSHKTSSQLQPSSHDLKLTAGRSQVMRNADDSGWTCKTTVDDRTIPGVRRLRPDVNRKTVECSYRNLNVLGVLKKASRSRKLQHHHTSSLFRTNRATVIFVKLALARACMMTPRVCCCGCRRPRALRTETHVEAREVTGSGQSCETQLELPN